MKETNAIESIFREILLLKVSSNYSREFVYINILITAVEVSDS
jgi:hypothetical protein